MDNRPHIMLGEALIVSHDTLPPRTLGPNDRFIEINGIKVLITKPIDLDNAYVVTKKYDGYIYFAHKTNVKDTQIINDAKVFVDLLTATQFTERRNAARQKVKYGIEKANQYFVYHITSSTHSTSNWDKPNYKYIHMNAGKQAIKRHTCDKKISLPHKVDHKESIKLKNRNDAAYHERQIKELEERIKKEKLIVEEYRSLNQLVDNLNIEEVLKTMRTENQDQLELLYETT